MHTALPTNRTLACAAATLALLGGAPAHAAGITWTTGPSFGGADGHLGILTNGTLVEAIDLGGTGSAITVDAGGLNIVFSRVDAPAFSASFADTSYGGVNDIGDAGWSAVINTAEYGSTGDVSAPDFLSGLTVGQAYQVQFFSGRAYGGLDNRLLTYGDGLGHFSPAVSMGRNVFTSMVGTFVADAATQHIVFDENTNLPTLNAYMLREVSAVPEPGTWALLLTGLAVTGRLVRRRAG